MTRFCEFIGNNDMDFDEVPKSERLCEYAGFSHCLKYNKPLTESDDGWRMCVSECNQPKYVIEMRIL